MNAEPALRRRRADNAEIFAAGTDPIDNVRSRGISWRSNTGRKKASPIVEKMPAIPENSEIAGPC